MGYGIWDGIWDLGYGMGYGIWDMGWDLGFGIWDGLWDLGLGYGCMGLGYDTNGIWDFPKSHSMGGKYRRGWRGGRGCGRGLGWAGDEWVGGGEEEVVVVVVVLVVVVHLLTLFFFL